MAKDAPATTKQQKPVTDLVSLDAAQEQYPLLRDDIDLAEIMEANIGGTLTEFDLDRLRIPAGGGLQWTVPSLEGDEDVSYVDGIIIHWKEARAFWNVPFDESGGGSPPDCSSRDGVHGVGQFGPQSEANPHGLCETCPMSEWGSRGEGRRGQACKQMRVVFLARPGDLLPIAVTLPPTSIGNVKRYLLRLASKAIPYYGVITRFGLERDRNKDGINYAKAAPTMQAALEPSVADKIRLYGDAVRGLLNDAPVDVEAVRADPS